MPILVYLFTGFLESGKTGVIKETLLDPEFNDVNSNLIIALEDGEDEYTKDFLKSTRSNVVYLNSSIELTKEKMLELDDLYKPDNVFIEYNGMESVSELVTRDLIKDWTLVQILTTIDASTFNVYLQNMKSLIYEQIKYSDLIIVNRCDENTNKNYLRTNIKACNRKAQIIYEMQDRTISELKEDELPFNLDDNPLVISDDDYGLWYMDALDHPDKYENKTVRIKGIYASDIDGYKRSFMLGRYAMVCCADDTNLIGLTVTGVKKEELKLKDWFSVEGVIHNLNTDEGKVCVLYATKVFKEEPLADGFVYFS